MIVAASFIQFLCVCVLAYLFVSEKKARRKQTARADTAERAYAELIKGSVEREQALQGEVRQLRETERLYGILCVGLYGAVDTDMASDTETARRIRDLRRRENSAVLALRDVQQELSLWRVKLTLANEDADRLYKVASQYLADIDKTAALMQDPEPPKMAVEREALRLHEAALKARN